MPSKNYATLNEILTQTIAWEDAIKVVNENEKLIKELDLKAYSQVLIVGCGSTYYLSLAAASLFQSQLGVIAKAYPSSELLLFPKSVYTDGKILLIAISRSGSTTETLRVVEAFKRERRGHIIVITNYSDSPLATLGDICLSINKGQEKSVAQTRSFASMFVALSAMVSCLEGNKKFDLYQHLLLASGNRIINTYKTLVEQYARNNAITQFFFLGSGSCYGLACETSLKLKEMSQTITEPFHFLEFRHGPISMVNQNTLIIGLISENASSSEMAVLKDTKNFGAKILTVGEKGTDIEFQSGLPEYARYVLYLPVLQLLAYYRAINFDKNPDEPRNITAVVEFDMIS